MTPTGATGASGPGDGPGDGLGDGLGGRLFLVRHGRPSILDGRPAHEWPLDADGYAGVEALRASGRLPAQAVWYSSPEPKALETARRLTQAPVTVVEELREHVRGVTAWVEDPVAWRATVRRVFDVPDEPAMPGWEPLDATRARLLPAVRRILDRHAGGDGGDGEDVVLAGHGTAWTLLRAELTGTPPDLDAWAALRMPDVWVVPRKVIRCGRGGHRSG